EARKPLARQKKRRCQGVHETGRNWITVSGAMSGAIILIGLFLDQRRAELEVDRALDRGALVVAHVHRTRQFDEPVVERLVLFLEADAVLDVPQGLVDLLEFGALGGNVGLRCRMSAPRRLQRLQLAPHIGPLGFVMDALGLDLQDRDLVDQLAEGYRYFYRVHGRGLFGKATA